MPRHSPCALISLTIFLVLRKNYAGHRSFSISRSNCSFTHNSTKKSVCFALQRSTLCCLALLSHHFSIVQFSRCRLRSKTGSKHLNTFKCFDPFSGGDNRNRTDDLLRAKQALSQLSYTPGCRCFLVVGPSGLEPPTSRLSVVRSSQLSYGPIPPEGIPSKLNNVRAR